MGCDGGTIPRRDELVRTKKKKEKKDKEADLAAKWKYCSISSKDLRPPIVSCELGRLYNKDAIIEYLLNKESPNSSLLSHIRNLKDFIELKLKTKSIDEKSSSSSNETNNNDNNGYKFICPIVGLEMNGNYKFVYLRQCGCVLSERAMKEVKSQSCLSCNKPFIDDDIIMINGDDDEVEDLRKRMIERRNKRKLDKKRKREPANNNEECSSNETKTKNGNKIAKSEESSSNNNNVKTSSLSVLSEKASKNYSVKNDPKASEAYKSLFTTHESAKNKPKAHWVTFNPCYN